MKFPKLTLVGAGPGDPELITLKAIRALRSADVVLFDALANPDLLDYAPSAEYIFVGKRAGKHYSKQENINTLIVEKALARGHVVRLKGGDPFIFGRGYEELEYAQQYGIPVEVVPGVSSMNLPGLLGVPLTARGINESVFILTGTTSAQTLSKDLSVAAQTNASVVVFMGLRKLPEIAAVYESIGKENTPALLIQEGSLPTQEVLHTTISELPERARHEGFRSPAIILIGPVAALYGQKVPAEKSALKAALVAQANLVQTLN